MINHLKALKKSGVNVHALEQYQSRSGHAAKRDFVKDLSLDFNASFCKAVQKTEGSKSKRFDQMSGYLYLWEVAKEVGLDFSEANIPLLKMHVNLAKTEEAHTQELRDAGHMKYWFEGSQKGTRTDAAKRTIAIEKEAELKTEQEYNQVHQALKDAGVQDALAGSSGSRPQRNTQRRAAAGPPKADKSPSKMSGSERKEHWQAVMEFWRAKIVKELSWCHDNKNTLKESAMVSKEFLKKVEEKEKLLSKHNDTLLTMAKQVQRLKPESVNDKHFAAVTKAQEDLQDFMKKVKLPATQLLKSSE